jgi:hypothetical protein
VGIKCGTLHVRSYLCFIVVRTGHILWIREISSKLMTSIALAVISVAQQSPVIDLEVKEER